MIIAITSRAGDRSRAANVTEIESIVGKEDAFLIVDWRNR
jgi:hypothetical protein